MRGFLSLFKNKYFVTLSIFLGYTLFLDDYNIFTIISQRNKLVNLETQRDEMRQKLNDTKNTFLKLNKLNYLESYARSEKFFKKDNEEIFVISYE